MKKSDIPRDQHRRLYPLPEASGAFALVPDPVPRTIPESWSVKDMMVMSGIAMDLESRMHRLASNLKALPDPDTALSAMLIREAVLSSQIEGTETDVEDFAIAEADPNHADLPDDVPRVRAASQALRQGLDVVNMVRGRTVFTVPFICSLHRILLADATDADGPGTLRTVQNRIGGRSVYDATYVPPLHNRVPDLMNDLSSAMVTPPLPAEQGGWPLTARLALAHGQFEVIHPFRDGNGRVGRMLTPLMLAAEGFPPVAVGHQLLQDRDTYFRELRALGRTGNWRPWIAFFQFALMESVEEIDTLIAVLMSASAKWETRVAHWRGDAVIRRLPKHLIAQPVLSSGLLQRLDKCSAPSANEALKAALEIGMVEQVNEGRRNRLFAARWALAIINPRKRRPLALP